MELSKNKFYVGTARGLLLCTTEKKQDIKFYKSDDSSEVTSLVQGTNPQELVVGYESGNAFLFDIAKSAFIQKLEKLEGQESIIGISTVNETVYLGKRDGVINMWNGKKNNYFSLNLEEDGTLEAMAIPQNRVGFIATGGQDNDYKVWNVETEQSIFKAKSLGLDQLQLRISATVKGLTFLHNNPHLGSVCTKEGHVLVYDENAQRKPVIRFNEPKASYTTISTAYKEYQVMLGTTKGYMQWLDLRQPSKVLKTYTTFTGCVSDISCCPVEPYVVSVSLDRHLRVHHKDSKEVVQKIYMKQNLTKVFVQSVIKDEVKQEEQIEASNEFNMLIEGLEEIRDDEEPVKKKRKKKGVNGEKKVKTLEKS